MFKIQELVNLINSGLNGVDENYSFNVYAEVGEEKNDGSINGILRTIGNDTTKVKGNSETRYTFVVEMPIISPRTNSNFLEIQQIVEQFVSLYNGSQQEFSSGNGVLHINMGVPKQFNVSVNLGDNVPLAFTIEMLYTENNVTNADKHWFLDGYEIPFKSENVLVNKDGIVRKINNKNYTEAFLTGQTKYYKFIFPHQDTELGNMIQADLLSGNFNKEYTLTYYDGRTFTEESPFETKVSIYQSGDVGTQEISVDVFNLTFADVDNGEYDWTYEFALIDSKFDNQTEDTRWFNSQAEQQAYYNNKISNGGCAFVTIKAPNLNSLDITSQVYPNPKNAQGNNIYNVFDLTNKNYAIIKATRPVGQITQTRYFYYWVTNAQIGANGQVMFDLNLDTVQTYLFDEDIEFGDCLIERSCLNRFVDNGNGTVSFDGGVNSKLFAREKVQDVPKRLTKRTKLGACNTGDENFDNWINEHILGWVYCYVNPVSNLPCAYTKGIDVIDNGSIRLNSGFRNISNDNNGYIPSPFPVIAFPVLKKSTNQYRLEVVGGDGSSISHTIELGDSFSYDEYLDPYESCYFSFLTSQIVPGNDDLASNIIISAKFSTLCPFKEAPDVYNIYQDNMTIYVDKNVKPYGATLNLPSTWTEKQCEFAFDSKNQINYMYMSGQGKRGFLILRNGINLYDLGNYEIDKTLTFNKTDIIDADKNAKFNPKLLSQDYFELQVCDETENGFSYDLQKLNKNEVQIGLTEPLTPDNTKKYIRITNNDGVYSADTSKNLLGFVNNNDQTIIMASDQYANMLAQNKNYFTQNALNREMGAVRALTGIGQGITQGAVMGALTGNPVGAMAGAVVGGIGQGVGAMLDYVNSEMQQNLTIDNLKNAPGSIKQALGNCYFGAQYTEPGTYVEEYDILPAEKNVINDYMVQYGFTTNQIGQIKDYLNNSPQNARKYFNYIKAVVNSISGIPMSNTARQNLRDRFAKGIRFWNDDNVDYDKENYEKWLEDDLTGTVWQINNEPDIQGLYNLSGGNVYNINYTSNNKNYIWLSAYALTGKYDLRYRKSNQTDNVCVQNTQASTWTWTDNAYKTIEIVDGDDTTNADLIAWLKANATLIAIKR